MDLTLCLFFDLLGVMGLNTVTVSYIAAVQRLLLTMETMWLVLKSL